MLQNPASLGYSKSVNNKHNQNLKITCILLNKDNNRTWEGHVYYWYDMYVKNDM